MWIMVILKRWLLKSLRQWEKREGGGEVRQGYSLSIAMATWSFSCMAFIKITILWVCCYGNNPSQTSQLHIFFGTPWNINTLQTLWAVVTSPTNSTANDQRQRLHATGAKAICNQHPQRPPNTDREHCNCILENFSTNKQKQGKSI